MDPVAIVGVGMTDIRRERREDIYADLVFEACQKALGDAGMTAADIDVVLTGSNDFFDGRTISSMAVMDACGSYDKNVSTVEGDGTFGAAHAVMRVLAGWGTCLFCVHHKGSESVMPLITNAMFDPIYERFLGIESIASSALQARAYMDATGATEEDCARVSVKNHGNAFNNSMAQMPLDITVEDVMASAYIAEPLKLLDCSPVSDGASAVVIASAERAKGAARKPVWVKGIGYNCDAFHLRPFEVRRARRRREESIQGRGHQRPAGPDRPRGGLRRLLLHGADVARRAGAVRPGGGRSAHGLGEDRAWRCAPGERLGRMHLRQPGSGLRAQPHHRMCPAGARGRGRAPGRRRQDRRRAGLQRPMRAITMRMGAGR
jgi:hypothetical protein